MSARSKITLVACGFLTACGGSDASPGANDDAALDVLATDSTTNDTGANDAPSDTTSTPDASDATTDARTDSAIDAPSDAATTDPFGVRELYPTTGGGREWWLPDDAQTIKGEWQPETDDVTKVSPGVFHTFGEGGQVRLNVTSPAGKAWWRNVEMTAYFRYTADKVCCGQVQHWELFARGERHSETNIAGTAIDDGVSAPPGTATWPGYPYGSGLIDVHCLGTAYHGNVYPTGRVLFEKEVSHSNGYGAQKATKTLDRTAFPDPLKRWFGMKFVARNAASDSKVHLEVWLDANADGTWSKVTEVDDTKGSWAATSTTLDGCTSAPFSYVPDQLLTWAGPWVTFRSDSIEMDFKWLSVREVGPLP